MNVLITGCGRSATRYCAALLHRCKVNIGHEEIRGRGTVSWIHAPMYNDFQLVLRQIRNPRLVASSFGLLAKQASSWNLANAVIKRYFDVDIPDHEAYPLEAGVVYTYFWNKYLDDKVDYSYRIEDMASELPKILSLMNIDTAQSVINSAIVTTPRTGDGMGRKGFQYYSWGDIEKVPYGVELIEFADKWGYLNNGE